MKTIVVDNEIILPEYILYNPELHILRVHHTEISQELLHSTIAYGLLIRSVTKVDYRLLEGTYVHFVGTATSGDDHIDESYCMTNRITVRTAKGSNAIAVCEYVLNCLEFAGRKTGVLGIVGYGEIGSRLARFATDLGFEVVVNDPFKRLDIINNTKYQYAEFDELIRNSDIISLHVPLHNNLHPTKNLLNEQHRSAIKNGTTIVHACRGGVVNEDVFFRPNTNDQFEWYIDVWENEPNLNDTSVLATQLATPHIAGYTLTAKETAGAMVSSALMKHFFKEFHPVSVKKNATINRQTLQSKRQQQLRDCSHQLRSTAKSNPKNLGREFEHIRSNLPLLPEYLEDIIN